MKNLSGIIDAVVQTKSYGPVRVGDALALFDGADDFSRIALAVVYGWSQKHAKDEYLARKNGPVITARTVNAARVQTARDVGHVVATSAIESKSERNRRLWSAFVTSGGDTKSPGGAAWLAFKADFEPLARPEPAPVVKARKVSTKAPSAAQLAVRERFANMTHARRAEKLAREIAHERAEGEALRAALKPVVTVQTVKATAPRQRAEPVELPAVVVSQPAVVSRVVGQDTSDDAMLTWLIDQPEPARVGMREMSAQFPGVSNNRKLRALAEIKALAS